MGVSQLYSGGEVFEQGSSTWRTPCSRPGEERTVETQPVSLNDIFQMMKRQESRLEASERQSARLMAMMSEAKVTAEPAADSGESEAYEAGRAAALREASEALATGKLFSNAFSNQNESAQNGK
eukprot:COSAG02_NODE_3765_length_6269_cov_7.859157_1_plen_124_part_00